MRTVCRIIGFAIILCVIVAALAMGAKRFMFTEWEEGLTGPYFGEPYTGKLVLPPASSLILPAGARLLVTSAGDKPGLVLTCQSDGGTNVWSRFFSSVVSESEYSNNQVRIEKMELKWVRRRGGELIVYVSGYWVPGGNEGGLVYVRHDLAFGGLRLDW